MPIRRIICFVCVNSFLYTFLPREAMLSAVYAVVVCLCVCLGLGLLRCKRLPVRRTTNYFQRFYLPVLARPACLSGGLYVLFALILFSFYIHFNDSLETDYLTQLKFICYKDDIT